MPISIWLALGSVAVTVLVQFAGIVWFAATQRAMLHALKELVLELKETVESVDKIATSLDKRVTVLEDRGGAWRRRATDSN